jgi:hypothetical protein
VTHAHRIRSIRLAGMVAAFFVAIASQVTAAPGPPKNETLHGYLMPYRCRQDDKATHSRTCALRAECMITGYGIVVANTEIVQFDQDSNKRAIQLLRETRKETDLRAVAEGYRVGTLFHVTRLQLE